MHQHANKELISCFQFMPVLPNNQSLEAVEIRLFFPPEVNATTQLMLQCAFIIRPNIVYSPWRKLNRLW